MNGYIYPCEPCPECGKSIARNWMVRHLKQEHPLSLPIETTMSYDQLLVRGRELRRLIDDQLMGIVITHPMNERDLVAVALALFECRPGGSE